MPQAKPRKRTVERVQIGVRLEDSIAQAMKAIAAHLEMPVGHLIEDVVNHALRGTSTFGDVRTMPPGKRKTFKSLLEKAGYTHAAHSPYGFVEAESDVPYGTRAKRLRIKRVAVGMRIEKRMVKVLKATAELWDMTFEQNLEGIITHALEGYSAFGGPNVKNSNDRAFYWKIRALMDVYGMTYGVHDHLAFAEKKGT